MNKSKGMFVFMGMGVIISLSLILTGCPTPDSGRNGVEAPFPDKIWGTAQLIENDTGEARNPKVGVDAKGNAIVVWYQSDGTRSNIWANQRR